MKIPKEVEDKLISALRSEGCLITVSELKNGKLNHYQYHRTIPRGDFEVILKGITSLLLPYLPNKNNDMVSTVKDY